MEGNAIVSTCLSELGYAELVTICRIRQLSKEPDHSPCSLHRYYGKGGGGGGGYYSQGAMTVSKHDDQAFQLAATEVYF